VSLASGLLAMTMSGLLARRLAGTAAGLAAAATYALLPVFVVYDVIGIADTPLAALTITALFLQVRLAERPVVGRALALGVVMAALVLTKETGKSAMYLLPLSLLCLDWSPVDLRARLARWAGCAAIAVGMTFAALAVLHSSSRWDQAQRIRATPLGYAVRPISAAFDDPIGVARINAPEYGHVLNGYLGVPLLLVAVAGLGLALRERPRLALLVTGWIGGGAVAALILPYGPFMRYLLWFLPIVVALIGVALARGVGALARLAGPRWSVPAVAAGLLAVLAVPLRLDARILTHPETTRYPGRDYAQYVTGLSAGSIWPAVAREIRRQVGSGPAIVARAQAATWVVELMLDEPDIRFVEAGEPAARRANLVLQDAGPFLDPHAVPLMRSARRVIAFRRPGRDGSVVRLYVIPARPARSAPPPA
jgi:4-amino-4-deoxy-L-arabinose transferase-like glycosyltransferase